jgi:hypothetical protein
MEKQQSAEWFDRLVGRWFSRRFSRSQSGVQVREYAAQHLATSLPSGVFELMPDRSNARASYEQVRLSV